MSQLTHKRHKGKSCYQISISVRKEQATCFFASLLKNCKVSKGMESHYSLGKMAD